MRTYYDGSKMGRRDKTKQNESNAKRDLLVFESKFRKSMEQFKSDKG